MPSAPTPGVFPYRAGITDVPYATQPWILGQYSGFAGPTGTNRRFRELIAAGQKGLAIALDLPTQVGVDPGDPLGAGEVGRVGVSLARLGDVQQLFDGIRLSELTQISTTANSIGPPMIGLFLAMAEERGEDPASFSLRLQNDVLKEYVARSTQVLPPGPAVEFATDAVEYCSARLPDWVPMSISGYHMRDAGAVRGQELGFTLANARAYISAARRRGVDVAAFARSITWFLSAAPELLDEVAKFRAARELWALTLRDEYGLAEDDPAVRLRLISYTLGGELSPFEILGNSVRVTLAALAAVLGGVQVLFCSAIDEALGLPTDEHALHSLRTQQIILRESGIARFTDALGGSAVVEALTDELIAEARDWDRKVTEHGGAVAAVQSGWMRAQIDDSAWQKERAYRAAGGRVGEPGPSDTARLAEPNQETFTVDPGYEHGRREEFEQWRAARPRTVVDEARNAFAAAVRSGTNLVRPCQEAFLRGLSLGEVMRELTDLHGRVSGSVTVTTGAGR